MTKLESRMEKRPELAQTQATRHPHWKDAINDIEMRFRETPQLLKIAIDATSARLMRNTEREKRNLTMLGELATRDLRDIWKKWKIDAAQENTPN